MTDWQIAIETSSRQGSVALLRGDLLVRQIALPPAARSAQTFAPALNELLQQLRSSGERLAWVSVGVGPGSFTGLRIAVTAAKTLAFALRCPVAPCDCLQAIVHQLREAAPTSSHWDAAVEAYRGQVFWRHEATDETESVATTIVDRDVWWEAIRDGSAVVGGDAWQKLMNQPLPPSLQLAPQDQWTPLAATIGKLGFRCWQAGECRDPFNVMPTYLRESAAIEKLAANSKTNTDHT